MRVRFNVSFYYVKEGGVSRCGQIETRWTECIPFHHYGGPGGRYSRQCCHSSCSHVSRITPAICAAPSITLVLLQWKSFTLTARSNRTLILCTQALELYVKTICRALLSPSKLLNSRGRSQLLFFCTRAMVLLEKFVGVSRDAGMDGLLHETRAIIMDYM